MVNWVDKSPHFSCFDSPPFINSRLLKMLFGDETHEIKTKISVEFQDIGWFDDDMNWKQCTSFDPAPAIDVWVTKK